MDDRSFQNPFKDLEPNEKERESISNLIDPYKERFTKKYQQLLEVVRSGVEEEDDRDYSVYTGSGGIALLYFHLYEINSNKGDVSLLNTSLDYIKRPLHHLKGRKLTFLCGDGGPLALAAVIYSLLGKPSKSQKYLKRLTDLSAEVLSNHHLPDELFNGRVGYLYALLFVQKKLGEDAFDKSIIAKIVKTVLESGQVLAKRDRWQHPLMYQWHEKYYFGAAHGMAGILNILLQIKKPSLQAEIDSLVKPTVDYMLSLQFPSGNCPSSVTSIDKDKLVHWCHGAPGWIYMFIQAYKKYSDSKYLDAAKRCANVIWSRGILKKGYGLCHGTAGNGYSFLAMYNLTGEKLYLHRAIKFAEWCCDYGKHDCRFPDTPYSLFEGMAGTVYFMSDILNPENAGFPAFEIT
ncbi:glutathione S-transferase LANCL1-like [Ostrea edulis]|uniref:glutathione S-transferase LANCL1-like n=1 Tax=Ostrea edulis TaxID=37623 RepID=UPI0024AFE815|nr:glutathione S-transferase LANCL1-like [Ostrea edulis]